MNEEYHDIIFLIYIKTIVFNLLLVKIYFSAEKFSEETRAPNKTLLNKQLHQF
jgi:hypothetical protein